VVTAHDLEVDALIACSSCNASEGRQQLYCKLGRSCTGPSSHVASATHILFGLQIRPPVEHQWGCGPLVHAVPPAPVSVFRHRLLQLFQLSVFSKLPILPMTTMHDLRQGL